MKIEVVKHFVTDDEGTHLRGLSSTSAGVFVTSGRSRELRGLLAEAMGVDTVEIVEIGRIFE